MSRENVERLRQSMDAFNRSDFAAALEFFDPQAEWTAYLSALEAKTYRGRAEIASMWSDVRTDFPDFRSEPTEILDCGDTIVASVEFSGIGRGSGGRHANKPLPGVLPQGRAGHTGSAFQNA